MNLVIGGGGYKGLIFLGVLNYLEKTKKLKNIENFYGSSIGSIICVFIAMKISPSIIYEELMKLDIKNYLKIDVNGLLTNFTLIGTKFFEYWVEYFGTYEDKLITIKEFNDKYKIKINIITTCINSRNTKILNEENTPNVKLLDAVLASCSIPFIFPPVKIDSNYYIDGDTKPWYNHINEYITEDTIIITLKDPNYNEDSMNDIMGYIREIMFTIITGDSLKSNDLSLTLDTPQEFLHKLNFEDLSGNDKTCLYLSGIKQARDFFKNKLN